MGDVERLFDVGGADGLVPGIVPAQPILLMGVDGLVDHDPPGHPATITPHDLLNRVEEETPCGRLVQSPQVVLRPILPEPLVPDQVSAQNQLLIPLGEGHELVGVLKVQF
jgi:hypothetical protein